MSVIWGWDASHYDAVPDGARVVAEGYEFMTHKAGGDADDAELAAWWKAMKPHRDDILLGAYWVLYPGSPSTKADRFLARLDSQCPGWRDGPFILQVDCEKWNGDSSTVPSKADIKAFCNRLKQKAPKLTPIVYAPKWVYGNTLTGLGYPLWASAYVDGSGAASKLYPGDNSSKWDDYSGQTPAILQFTSSATIAGQTTCDANAFKGSRADLVKLLAPGWVPKPPEPEEDPLANLTAQDIADAILNSPIGNENYPKRTVRQTLNDLSNERDAVADANVAGSDKAIVAPGTPLANIIASFSTPPEPSTGG
jgi:lysozyme